MLYILVVPLLIFLGGVLYTLGELYSLWQGDNEE